MIKKKGKSKYDKAAAKACREAKLSQEQVEDLPAIVDCLEKFAREYSALSQPLGLADSLAHLAKALEYGEAMVAMYEQWSEI